jgi:CheY-like chemotaxis protein
MKILIVEDDFDKRQKIKNYIFDSFGKTTVVREKESLRSGLKEVVEGEGYDLLLLDMSMPSFDVGADEPGGGTPESFAGKELMSQMKLRNICIPVVVITQYDTFEEGTVSLEDLSKDFVIEFGDFFLGAVFYSSAIDGWKAELAEYLKHLEEK